MFRHQKRSSHNLHPCTHVRQCDSHCPKTSPTDRTIRCCQPSLILLLAAFQSMLADMSGFGDVEPHQTRLIIPNSLQPGPV